MARKKMAREKQHDYDDIPGTYVFDAERSRQGFGINMFCMSLMKDDNRRAFKANEAEYLKKFNLTPEQTDAILKRDYNRMLELGGNIYFTAKLGTGSSQQDYASMMLAGGRSVEGNRSRSGKKNAPSKFLRAGGSSGKPAAAKRQAKAKATSKAKPKSKTRSAKRK